MALAVIIFAGDDISSCHDEDVSPQLTRVSRSRKGHGSSLKQDTATQLLRVLVSVAAL